MNQPPASQRMLRSARSRGYPLSLGLVALVLAGITAMAPASLPAPVRLAPGVGVAAMPAPLASGMAAEASLGERALEVVRALADDIGSRPAGSPAEERAAGYLADLFTGMGYAVEIVPFSFSARSGSGTSRNVVARHPSEDPNAPLVIIGGHYDTVPMGPGANDNASGTAVVVEVARELARSPIRNVAVRYVAFGAEEIGLLGSKDYVGKLSATDRGRLALMMSIDMIAVGDRPVFGGTEFWVREAMARAASQGHNPMNHTGSLRRMSDHASFLDAGLPGVMFHWFDDPFYHTALDVSANVQWESLELMGAIAIDLVRLAATR